MNDAPERPLRILVNAIHARAGGGLTYLRQLLPLLAQDPGLTIRLVPHPSQAANFAALLPDVEIHPLTMPRGWAALLLWEQIILPVKAARLGYDLMLSPANFGPLAVGRQVLVLQNALGVGAWEKRLGKKLYWAVLRWMTILSLRRARAAIAVSRYAAASAKSRLLPHPEPQIIHHGVGPEFSPAPVSREDFLLAVGDLYMQKNLHRLIEALALVRQRYPQTTLRIAGTAVDKEYAASLHRQIAALGLDPAVQCLGRVTLGELIELYRRCAIFVFPSTEESFGMPLLEAMACGAPVITSDSAAMPEIAGDAAVFCSPESSSALAAAILDLLGNEALRHDLRSRAVARAVAFSWADCASHTAALLRQAALAPRRPRVAAIFTSG